MTTFITKFGPSQIDRATGVIKGVCLLKIGEALGHSVFINSAGLQTFLTACKRKKSLRVKLDHTHSASAFVGVLSNFRIDNDCLRADLELLKTSEYRDYILEIATKIPDQFGLSCAFEPTTKIINGKNFVSCKSISSVDIVSDPAATTGLFEAVAAASTLTNTATSIPSGVKPKTRTINVVCPNCEAHLETFSKLAVLHNSAADKLSDYIDSLAQKDNVSSVPTEAQFQARLDAQKLELEKSLDAKASVMASRMLAATGVKLSRIPDADICITAGPDGILAQLDSITNETEKGLFYQRHKDQINKAFQRMCDRKTQLANQR